MVYINRQTVILLAITSIVLFTAGCAGIELTGRWRDRDIEIDGADTEWRGARFLLDKEYITLGVMNDRDYLYLRLSTPDRIKQIRILRHGLTVTFEPEGKKTLTGVRFPVEQNEFEPGFEPPGPGYEEKSVDAHIGAMIDSLSGRMELLLSKDHSISLPRTEAAEQGIQTGIGFTDGVLIYELKVPMKARSDESFSIGAEPGKSVTIGLEIGKPDDREMRDDMRRRQGSENGRVSARPNVPLMSNPMFDEYKVWVKVFLASPQ